jgi:hypothetical protein
MYIYDESTSRRTVWSAQINWSRPLAFSVRQRNYILSYVPHERGVYCIYSKNHTFSYVSAEWPTQRWSSVIYLGSGWLDSRLFAHLHYQRNDFLCGYLNRTDLAYRYAKIGDSEDFDWPRLVEAGLLGLFEHRFGQLPPCNRRRETFPDVSIDRFAIRQSLNFDYLARG